MLMVVVIDETINATNRFHGGGGAASRLSYPLRLFPIYFPMGNMATGLFVLFALLAGVVGVGSSIAGILSIKEERAGSWASGASFALVAWALTILSMG